MATLLLLNRRGYSRCVFSLVLRSALRLDEGALKRAVFLHPARDNGAGIVAERVGNSIGSYIPNLKSLRVGPGNETFRGFEVHRTDSEDGCRTITPDRPLDHFALNLEGARVGQIPRRVQFRHRLEVRHAFDGALIAEVNQGPDDR